MSIGKYNSDGNIYSVAEANEKFSGGGGDVGELTTRVENLETDNTKNKNDISTLSSKTAILESDMDLKISKYTSNDDVVYDAKGCMGCITNASKRIILTVNDASLSEGDVIDIIDFGLAVYGVSGCPYFLSDGAIRPINDAGTFIVADSYIEIDGVQSVTVARVGDGFFNIFINFASALTNNDGTQTVINDTPLYANIYAHVVINN